MPTNRASQSLRGSPIIVSKLILRRACALTFLACTGVLLFARSGNSREIPIKTECRVLAEIEGGPVLVEITRRNQGPEVVIFEGNKFCLPDCTILSGPPGWKPPDIVGGWTTTSSRDPGASQIRIPARSSITNVANLQQWYGDLPCGSYLIQVSTYLDAAAMGFGPNELPESSIGSKLEKNSEGMVVRQLLRLEVVRATEANLASLCTVLTERLKNNRRTSSDVHSISLIVCSRSRRQFDPIVFRLLLCPEALESHADLIGVLLSAGRSLPPSTVEQLLAYMARKDCLCALAFFHAPGVDNFLTDKSIVQALSTSASPWVRVGLYLHAPKRCDDLWVKLVLAAMRRVKEPVSIGELTPYSKDLGDDQFLTRRKAAEALQAMGEAAVPGLVQLSHDPKLSPEQAAGIDRVIKKLRKKPDPFEEHALKHIEIEGIFHGKAKEAIRILQALSQNDPEFYISQQAKELLAQMEKASKAQPNGAVEAQDPLELRPKPPSDKPPQ